jgi:hypothetical protein
MKPRKQSTAAKVRKLRPRIERELQQGMSKNTIRKKMIIEKLIDLTSTAHFNKIVSEFELDGSFTEAMSDDFRVVDVSAITSGTSDPVPPQDAPYLPPVTTKPQAGSKRYFDTPSDDDRFDAEMSGGGK